MVWPVSQDFTAEEKGSSWKGERDGDPDMEEALADGARLFPPLYPGIESSQGGWVQMASVNHATMRTRQALLQRGSVADHFGRAARATCSELIMGECCPGVFRCADCEG